MARGTFAGLLAGLVLGACSPGGDAASGPVVDGDAIGVEGAHEHGVVRMGFAVDETRLTLDLQAPAAALFGFEHTPETDEEREIVRRALTRLRENAGTAVAFSDEVRCDVGRVEILEGPELDESDSEADPSQAGESEAHEHDAQEQDADEHDGGGHEHDADDVEHSEVRVTVVWRCDASPEGTPAALQLGQVLTEADRVDLTVITSRGQAGGRVSADAAFSF